MPCGWQQKLSAAAIPIWERVTGNYGGGWRANRQSRLWPVTLLSGYKSNRIS
jgi:hypothetical protein